MTSKKKKSLVPHGEYLTCAKFTFFPWSAFGETEVQSFSIFPTWLPHQLIYDIIIIMKTFHRSSRFDGENFVSSRQMVVEKNTKVLCGQTDRQTNKQTNKQTVTNAIPTPPARIINANTFHKVIMLAMEHDTQCDFIWWRLQREHRNVGILNRGEHQRKHIGAGMWES